MAVTCCYKCPRRTETCHFDGTCEEYLKQSKANEADREARHKNAAINEYMREQSTQIIRRMLRHEGVSRKSKRRK